MIRTVTRNSRGTWRASRLIVPLLCLVAAVPWSSPEAGTVNGSAILRATATEDQGRETDRFQQNYNISAFQNFTPYLTGRLTANYIRWDQRVDDFTTDQRRLQPTLDLGYTRERVVAKLTYLANLSSGTFDAQDFQADPSWPTSPGDRCAGRATYSAIDARRIPPTLRSLVATRAGIFSPFQAYYGRDWGMLRYTLDYNDLANNSNGTNIEQFRNEISANWSTRMRDNRLNVGVSSRLSRVDQTATLSSTVPHLPSR